MSINRKCEFICNTLFYQDGIPLDINEIIQLQNRLLGINMYIDDVEESLAQLDKDGHVNKSDEKYSLSFEARRSIEINSKNQNDLKDAVINKWLNDHIRKKYSFFSPRDLEDISHDLLEFLEELFIHHGIQSVNSLMFGKIEEFDVPTIISKLPKRSAKITDIRESEFRLFLGLDDVQVKKFLHYYNQKSYIYI
jgi:hypothetical protein